MKKWISFYFSILIFNILARSFSQSLFDNLDSSNSNINSQSTSNSENAINSPSPILQPPKSIINLNSENNEGDQEPSFANLNTLIEKLKDKVENPALKNNLNIEAISNYLANILSGNEISNNLEVKNIAHIGKLEVGEKMKIEGDAIISNLNVKEKFTSKVFNITDDRLSFNPDATIKMTNSKLVFKIKDIFEVITFMKYIVKICGSRLERCDFNSLLNNNQQEQMKKVMNLLDSRQKEISKLQSNFDDSSKIDSKKLNHSVKKNLRKTMDKNPNKSSEIYPEDKLILSKSNDDEMQKSSNNNNTGKSSNSTNMSNVNSYMFKQRSNKNELFEHQDEIEKELNLQLKLYKERQKQELFENSYESFLNKNKMFNEEQTLNDYYYNLDMNFLV